MSEPVDNPVENQIPAVDNPAEAVDNSATPVEIPEHCPNCGQRGTVSLKLGRFGISKEWVQILRCRSCNIGVVVSDHLP